MVGGTGLRGLGGMLYSSLSSGFPFVPPQTNQINKTPPAEPSTNLFVSGLSKRTTTEKLQEAFAKFGAVVHSRVVTDRASGYSKGFGFVRYASLDEAAAGIKGMDGQVPIPYARPFVMDDFSRAHGFLDGWVIFAEYTRPRQPPGQLPENNGLT